MRMIHKALLTCAVATTCGCAGMSQQSNAPGTRDAASTVRATGAARDWPTFGGSNARSNANMAPTKITAANVGSMVRQQVTISAPIDAGLIYLSGVKVNGASRVPGAFDCWDIPAQPHVVATAQVRSAL